jgi:hypothetical protein
MPERSWPRLREERSRRCSGQVRLNELWTGVDVDLAQDGLSGVNKAVRSVGRDDDNPAGFHFTGLIADRDRGTAFKRERDFNVRMCVQWRTLPWFCINDVGRERRALFFSDKLIRHSDKRELLEIQKRHGKTDAPPAARDKTKVLPVPLAVSVFASSQLRLTCNQKVA